MQKNLTVYSMSLAGRAALPTASGADRHRRVDRDAWRILSVAARFPLYKTAAAHKAVEAGGKVGTLSSNRSAENKALRSPEVASLRRLSIGDLGECCLAALLVNFPSDHRR